MKKIITFLLLYSGLVNSGYAQLIKVEQTTNYDSISLKKLDIAIRLLDSVLKTDDFKQRVKDAKFVGTKGKSNTEILDYLLSGNSDYDNSNDKVINLYLDEYDKYGGGDELGVTTGKITSTHRCFILRNDPRCLAAHLLHEYLHVMGFSHRMRLSELPKRKTVPYVIGNIVKAMLDAPGCPAIKETCNY